MMLIGKHQQFYYGIDLHARNIRSSQSPRISPAAFGSGNQTAGGGYMCYDAVESSTYRAALTLISRFGQKVGWNIMGVELKGICMDSRMFVASNMYSLAEAQADGVSNPYAIYNDDTIVGFIMYDFDAENATGYITRLMIDHRYQGNGYGRAAMSHVVKKLKSTAGCTLITTSFVPENTAAKSLYLSLGFTLTGELEDGEEVCVLRIAT